MEQLRALGCGEWGGLGENPCSPLTSYVNLVRIVDFLKVSFFIWKMERVRDLP